jgi:trimeric autotransporter adhesin
MTIGGKGIFQLALSVVMVAALIFATLPSGIASAAQITTRSLTLQAGASAGGAQAGGVVNHLYNFTVPTTEDIGSIQFLYCTTASGTCTTPTGLSTTAATMGTQSGATGFTLNNTTNGAPYITRTAASIAASTALSYQLLSVTNPTTVNQAFYVRISTFTSTDTTGSATDTGTVAASTSRQIILTGTMPESLIFCAGATITTTNGIPDCTSATTGAVTFNQLFSPTDTATATSQMAASTNGSSGYNITVNGTTMSSGSNTIAAMGTATTGVRGTSQFGMNLKANTTSTSTPAVGTEVAPAANGTSLKGQALTGYSLADTFKFTSGDSVASSSNGGTGPTDAQIFTASYIVNVSGSQTAGTYTTTLTYICTATF